MSAKTLFFFIAIAQLHRFQVGAFFLLCSPAISLRLTILDEIFVYVTVSNPTIQVIT